MLKLWNLIFLLIAPASFAWFCPGNFNVIQEGDPIEKVKKQCGTPSAEKTTEEEPDVPQEWQYYVAVNQPYQATYTPSTNAPAIATIKMSVTFIQGKAINISVENQSLTSTSLCGPTISTGDGYASITRACGKPIFIQKQQGSENIKGNMITEFTYPTGRPNLLVFFNGRLKDVR